MCELPLATFLGLAVIKLFATAGTRRRDLALHRLDGFCPLPELAELSEDGEQPEFFYAADEVENLRRCPLGNVRTFGGVFTHLLQITFLGDVQHFDNREVLPDQFAPRD